MQRGVARIRIAVTIRLPRAWRLGTHDGFGNEAREEPEEGAHARKASTHKSNGGFNSRPEAERDIVP